MKYVEKKDKEPELPAQDIKGYRTKELPLYMVGNLLVLAVTSGAIESMKTMVVDTPESLSVLISALVEACAPLTIVYVYTFIFDSLISSHTKMRLAFAFSNQPGEQVFEKASTGCDNRFTVEKANNVYGTIYSRLPSEKAKSREFQNAEWYQLYKKYEFVPSIFRAHEDFLLCRDLFSLTLCLAAACGMFACLGTCGVSTMRVPMQFLVFLIFEAMATDIAARAKGQRFVMNVIAHDLSRYVSADIDGGDKSERGK